MTGVPKNCKQVLGCPFWLALSQLSRAGWSQTLSLSTP